MRRLSRRQMIEALRDTVSSALLLFVTRPSRKEAAGLHATETADSVVIDNGVVKARFRKLPSGIDQEYLARRSEGTWIPVIKSFRPPTPRPHGCAPLYADQDVAPEYRLLTAEAFRSVRPAQKSDGVGKCRSSCAEQLEGT
jgi:hypothetical protein